MPRFAIIGEIASGRMNDFLRPLMAHRARCLKDEPGTLNFEVLMPHDDNTKVMLYEVYQDEAAYDAHSKGPSIARLREEAAGMIVTVSGTRGTLLE